jgi:hypothetical protein
LALTRPTGPGRQCPLVEADRKWLAGPENDAIDLNGHRLPSATESISPLDLLRPGNPIPVLSLFVKVSRIIARRTAPRDLSGLFKAAVNLGIICDGLNVPGNLLLDDFGHRPRRKEAENALESQFRVAGARCSRHVRRNGRTFGVGDRDQSKSSGLRKGDSSGQGDQRNLNAALA